MRITKDKLKTVIIEEISAVLREKKAVKTIRQKQLTKDARERAKMLAARRRAMLGGDMMSLANGIVEEDEEIEEMNQNHGDDGKFSTAKDATCHSTYFHDGTRERVGGSVPRHEAGRGRKKNSQGRYRCKNPKATELKWESLVEPQGDDNEWVQVRKGELERLIEKHLGGMLDVYLSTDNGKPPVDESSVPLKLQNQCKRFGLRSLKDFLNMQNNFERSAKGTLHKKGGKD